MRTDLFGNKTPGVYLPAADTKNAAGGKAYKLSPEETLASSAVTMTFGGTIYQNPTQELEILENAAKAVTPLFLAKTAVYARKECHMKDSPAVLLAILLDRDKKLFEAAFPLVVDNGRMLRNFAQAIRSGRFGRKSFGGTAKRVMRKWLRNRDNDRMIQDSVGTSPSMADVIKMVRPRPMDPLQSETWKWLMGKEVDFARVEPAIAQYEAWKTARASGAPWDHGTPDVPMQLLTSQKLTDDDWGEIALRGQWHQTRMNLQNYARHNVFKDEKVVDVLANRLRDKEQISRARVMPLQAYMTHKAIEKNADIPMKLKLAVQDALDISLDNVPEIKGRTAIGVDVSGSMSAAWSGFRKGATSHVSFVDIAAIITAAILRKNPDAIVLPFDHDVYKVTLNPRDSIATIADRLSKHGGATATWKVFAVLEQEGMRADTTIIVSDMECWVPESSHIFYGGWHGAGNGPTSTSQWWNRYKAAKHSPRDAKAVFVNLAARGTALTHERDDVLRVGSFSDDFFESVKDFSEGRVKDASWWASQIGRYDYRGIFKKVLDREQRND